MLQHQPSLQSRSLTCHAQAGRACAQKLRTLQRGFTLIELMIAVAIVAVLAAFAIPSYQEYVKRGQIVDGVAPLAEMGGKMEQFFQDKRSYASACGEGALVSMPAATPRFTYSCTSSTTAYTVTATGSGPTQDFVFTINEKGARGSSVPTGWTAGTNCWSTRKDGGC